MGRSQQFCVKTFDTKSKGQKKHSRAKCPKKKVSIMFVIPINLLFVRAGKVYSHHDHCEFFHALIYDYTSCQKRYTAKKKELELCNQNYIFLRCYKAVVRKLVHIHLVNHQIFFKFPFDFIIVFPPCGFQ